MSKLIKCKSCGAEISERAKTCPQCGEKNKKPLLTRWWFWAIIVILAFCVIASSGDEPSPAPGGGNTDPSATTNGAPGIGDRMEMNKIYVTLNSVTESNGGAFNTPTDGNVFIICEFTIENESGSELAISSMMSFTAYADSYALNYSLSGLLETDKQQLDGTIAAGKKMNGVVAFEAPSDWMELEVRFSPNVYSSKEFVFAYTKDTTSAPAMSHEQSLINNDKIKVTFIDAKDESSLGVFYVTLKIENCSDSEIFVSLEDADVDGETIPMITTGVPLVIRPGNSGQTSFIFSMVNLSISSMDEAEQATFRIVARDNNTFDTIYESELVTVDLH